jgi:hypothetical protein
MDTPMLRIKMNVSMAGQGFGYVIDEIVEVPEDLARALCALPEGTPRADPVGWDLEPTVVETATAAKRSTAVARKTAATTP